MVDEVRLDFSAKKCVIILEILNADRNKYPSQNKLAFEIKIDKGNPYFREIFKYLREIEIITLDQNSFYEVNKKKLKGFLRDQDYVNKWALEFFRPYYPFP